MSREENEKIITAVLAKCKEKGLDEQLSIEALSSLNEEDLEYRDNEVIIKCLGEIELTGIEESKTIDEVIELFQKLKEDGFTKVAPMHCYGDFNGLYVEKIGREPEDMVIERVFDLVYKQYTKFKKDKEERERGTY